MRTIWLSVLLVSLGSARLMAATGEVQSIRGPGFEGQIFTPERVRADTTPAFYNNAEVWVPSVEVVRAAERALPGAVAAWVRPAPPAKGPNYPTCCPAKNGTNLRFLGMLADTRPDSVIMDHEFLRDVAPVLADFKRQYIGVTEQGRRVVYLNFIYGPIIDGEPSLRKAWRGKHWIEVLDGGDDFWDVLYDPATGTFSQWENGGFD